jgi:hypothetical protein
MLHLAGAVFLNKPRQGHLLVLLPDLLGRVKFQITRAGRISVNFRTKQRWWRLKISHDFDGNSAKSFAILALEIESGCKKRIPFGRIGWKIKRNP